jgi:threonine dehydratase
MTDLDQKQLGKTLWNIADTLRGAQDAQEGPDAAVIPVAGGGLSDGVAGGTRLILPIIR